jgi:hypothetical protein
MEPIKILTKDGSLMEVRENDVINLDFAPGEGSPVPVRIHAVVDNARELPGAGQCAICTVHYGFMGEEGKPHTRRVYFWGKGEGFTPGTHINAETGGGIYGTLYPIDLVPPF